MVLYDPDTKLDAKDSKKFRERIEQPEHSPKHAEMLTKARKNVKRLPQ